MPYPHDMVCESLKFPAPGSCQPNSLQSFVLVCQTFAFEIYGSWGSFLLHLILWGHRLSSSSIFGHIVPGLNAQHVKFHLLFSWCFRLTGLKIRRAQCQLPCTVGRQFLGFRSAWKTQRKLGVSAFRTQRERPMNGFHAQRTSTESAYQESTRNKKNQGFSVPTIIFVKDEQFETISPLRVDGHLLLRLDNKKNEQTRNIARQSIKIWNPFLLEVKFFLFPISPHTSWEGIHNWTSKTYLKH